MMRNHVLRNPNANRPLMLWLVFVAAVPVATAADTPQLRLWLKDNSFIDGQIQPAVDAGFVGLKSALFTDPVVFDVRGVRSIAGEYSPDEPKTGHAFLLEGGTRISGELREWNDNTVVVQSPSLGEITLQRSMLRAVEAIKDTGKRIYSGPNSIDDWMILDDTDSWTFSAGSLKSPDNEAKAAGKVDLPNRFRLALSMSWQGRADFVLSLGCQEPKKPEVKPANVRRRAIVQSAQDNAAVRLEMWDAQLAVVREVGNLADIAVLPLDDGISKFDLVFYVDQILGLVAVYSNRGKMLEKIQVAEEKGNANAFALLENHGKSVSLDRFDVFEWDGHLPDSTEFPDSYVLSTRDKIIAAEVSGFDKEKTSLTLVGNKDDGESTIPLDEVRRVVLVATDKAVEDGIKAKKAAKDNAGEDRIFSDPPLDESRLIEIDFADTSRLVGYIGKGKGDQFSFRGSGIQGQFTCHASQVVALSGSGERFKGDELPGTVGTLTTDDARIQGALIENKTPSGNNVLIWQPWASPSPGHLSLDQSGEITYKKSAVNRPQNVPPGGGIQALMNGPDSKKPLPVDPNQKAIQEPQFEIVFRSGDTVDGVVESVDEKGVTFRSGSTTTTFVPHAQMESIALGRVWSQPPFDGEDLERLLTVPRSKKDDPPTHLFLSTNGDFLRGRMVGINDEVVGVEVRLSVQEIPRANVARVIWLHERPWLEKEAANLVDDIGAAEEDVAKEDELPFLVHAVRRDSRGVTFLPKRLAKGRLNGTSDLLGECSVSLDEIRSLLFGKDVGAKALALRKESWKLSLAALPKAYLDTPGEDGDGSDATQSPLVGKDAPEITLQTIDDVEFVLSENRDKVIVLDFWASWCGPCIATMPKVDAIVAEFDPRKVELVAVNLQDSVEKARIALKRMEIEPTVVMDVDGETARFYDARAIPQTVIVDTDGKITHLFVGGGSKFLDQFSAALKEVLAK